MSDNELLELIKENDEFALEELIERYKVSINSIILKYKKNINSLGLDIKDLYQEGLIALFDAIKTYDENKDASFKTYTNIVINRKMLDLIKSHNRVKYLSLNSAVSLDSIIDEDGERSLYDKLEMDTLTPINKLISDEDRMYLKNNLTEFELKVYELKYEGKTNTEIALILDKDVKSIRNTIDRIKNKFKEIKDM